MSNFYAFMDRMKFIRRWSLMRSVREENILEHSAQVAMFAHALALIENEKFGGSVDVERTLLYALYHESSEVLTGDLPTPVKYSNAAIEHSYHALEKKAVDRLLSMIPKDMQPSYALAMQPDEGSREYVLVKCADKLSAYVKCLEELRSGNSEFAMAKASIEREMRERQEPSLDYFLSEFIPAFALTLDELNR